MDIYKNLPLLLILGQKRPWIRIQNPESRIRIKIKTLRIRIKAYADPKHWYRDAASQFTTQKTGFILFLDERSTEKRRVPRGGSI